MNCHLDHALGTEFGRALYFRRPVVHIMDAAPLVVEHDELIGRVAELAMRRPDAHLYDDVVVTDQGTLSGTVSIQGLLGTLAEREGVLETAGGVAHELNQPLQVVLGYTELLLNRLAADDSLRHVGETVRASIENMAGITRRLQTLTGIDTIPYIGNTRILKLRDTPQPSP